MELRDSDIEGTAARVAASECGQRASFNSLRRDKPALIKAVPGAGVRSLSSRAGIAVGLNIKQARAVAAAVSAAKTVAAGVSPAILVESGSLRSSNFL